VPSDIRFSRRLGAAARWPFGVGLTSWRYMWRITPMHRSEVTGDISENLPPPLPRGVLTESLQGIEDGSGALFHRRYSVLIQDTTMTPDQMMREIMADPNVVAPTEFARFHKTHGVPGEMNAGDEYLVHMPGPWDGPVRVVEALPTSFRFATLRGHLEAGQIEFRADRGADLVFDIESWARSGDRLSGLLFEQLRMAKEVQLHMWSSVLERVAEFAGGRLARGLTIETTRVDFDG
jgi:hypothetical protein